MSDNRTVRINKVVNIIQIILLVCLLSIQFIILKSNTPEGLMTSFASIKYISLSWAFGYFYFVLFFIAWSLLAIYFRNKYPKIINTEIAVAFISSVVFVYSEAFLKDDYVATVDLDILSVGADLVIIMAIIGILIDIGMKEVRSNFNHGYKKSIKDATFLKMTSGKDVFYENTVFLNPGIFVAVIDKPARKICLNKEGVIISGDGLTPALKISWPTIKSIKLSYILTGFLCIVIKSYSGQKFRIMYIPIDKSLYILSDGYNFYWNKKTREIYRNLKSNLATFGSNNGVK